jgi:hypothetical protein
MAAFLSFLLFHHLFCCFPNKTHKYFTDQK